MDPDSKSGQYAAAVLWFLNKSDIHASDGAVIRREVAKRCGVKPDKDESFAHDVGNALHRLKAQRRIERKGDMWSLVDGPGGLSVVAQ